MKKAVVVILAILAVLATIAVLYGVLVIHAMVWWEPVQFLPEEGIWYCEELQVQICFDEERDYYGTHIIIDGEKIRCEYSNDPGSRIFSVMYQDYGNNTYDYDYSFYQAECIAYDDQTMVTKEYNTGKEFIFARIN